MKTIKVTEQETVEATLALVSGLAKELGEGEQVEVKIAVLPKAYAAVYGVVEGTSLVLGHSGYAVTADYDKGLWEHVGDLLDSYCGLVVELGAVELECTLEADQVA